MRPAKGFRYGTSVDSTCQSARVVLARATGSAPAEASGAATSSSDGGAGLAGATGSVGVCMAFQMVPRWTGCNAGATLRE